MHDRLLARLQAVARVRLVAALRDDRLGFPAAHDLRIFIPDLHLISERRRKAGGFRYATNFPELLTEVVEELRKLRTEAGDDETVVVYQLGDFLDLWRESDDPDARAEVAARIKDDHADLVTALMHRRLKARFLLGNHDFDLRTSPDYTAWERRYYLPDTDVNAPRVIVLHGDIFDWVESIDDRVQRVLVYLFAPHLSPNDYALGDMEALIRRSHGGRNYRTYIQAPTPRPVASLRALGAGEPVPPRWNVQVDGVAPPENLQFLDRAAQHCRQANERYGLQLGVAVIGHTHHARIAVREAGGQLFTLIDCGAWIENCVAEGDAEPVPNAQIGALSANEARVYQLEPLA